MFDKSRRDIYPDDVRKDLGKYKNTVLGLSGIVTEHTVSPDGETTRIVIDHHYWDWIQDFGAQKEQIFLSPRGEGKFGFAVATSGERPDFLPVGSMALIFGTPNQLTKEGILVVDYQWAITIPKGAFATDFWDYGREYLLHGDKTDFKRLRVL